MGTAVALNFFIPLAAHSLPLLVALRIVIGVSEALFFPAATQSKCVCCTCCVLCAFMFVCVCSCVRVCVHAYLLCACVFMYECACACMQACMRAYMHVCGACLHVYMFAVYLRSLVHACARVWVFVSHRLGGDVLSAAIQSIPHLLLCFLFVCARSHCALALACTCFLCVVSLFFLLTFFFFLFFSLASSYFSPLASGAQCWACGSPRTSFRSRCRSPTTARWSAPYWCSFCRRSLRCTSHGRLPSMYVHIMMCI